MKCSIRITLTIFCFAQWIAVFQEEAKADTCVWSYSAVGKTLDERYVVNAKVDSEGHWTAEWHDTKSDRKASANLKGIERHSHLSIKVAPNGQTFAVLDTSAGHRSTDRIQVYFRDGTLIQSYGLKDLLNKDELSQVSHSVSHIQWLGFDEENKRSIWMTEDGTAIKLLTKAGRTVEISLNQRPDPFERFFRLPGIEFSDEQQKKVDDLQKEYSPKLAQNQRAWNSVITQEQVQARREAFRKAREAGKQGRELQEAVDAASILTDAQQVQRAKIQDERRQLLQDIRTKLIALLTDEQQSRIGQNAQRGQQSRRPTHPNVKYGPHERNVMDVWLAESNKPTPVLVSIHGGGFRGGNKGVQPSLLNACLDAGISVVAITYRLSDQAIAPAQHFDSARAIQFVRHNSKEWNIDPDRIAATGGSAGAGLSLWLGFHDDLSDPDSDDPVLRESTRLSCMSVYNGQSSYDPRFIRDLFPGTDTYIHPALAQLYDVDLDKLDDLPDDKYKLFEQVSAINHLTKGDAPAQLIYASAMETPITNQGIGIHHPKFAKVLKEKMDKEGIECQIHTNIRRGSEEWTELTMDFVKKHLKVE